MRTLNFLILLILIFLATSGHSKGHISQLPSDDAERSGPERTAFEAGTELNKLLQFDVQDGRLLAHLSPQVLDRQFVFVRYPVHTFQAPQFFISWHREGDKVLVLAHDVRSAFGPVLPTASQPIHTFYGSLQSDSTVLYALKLKETDESGRITVDVSDVFLRDIRHLDRRLGQVQIDESKIDAAKIYNETIVVRAILTFQSAPTNGIGSVLHRKKARWALTLLPASMMKPRAFDPRMAFYIETQALHHSVGSNRGAIQRWRLEKKNPESEISDPVKPIIFYLDPSIPQEWRRWVKEGVLSWKPAFRQAGFSNAISVRDPPNSEDWDLFRAAHSAIVWDDAPQFRDITPEYGSGGGTAMPVVDYRTGEILMADIGVRTPFEMLRDEYFVRVAPLDSRAETLNFSQELLGERLVYLVAHETGHGLGLLDGNFGEFAYPTELLRDPQWLETMGFSPSVMNYSRCNYVAQPEDGIDPRHLCSRVGPADHHQIEWGYREFRDTNSVESEAELLDKIIGRRDEEPWLNFVSSEGKNLVGPQTINEAVDSDNPILSTELGLKNLRRVVQILSQIAENGSASNEEIEHVYRAILDQWLVEMKHVSSLVGGYKIQLKSVGDPGTTYAPISGDQQERAVEFLIEHALESERWLSAPNITRRFSPSAGFEEVVERQSELLEDLLSPAKLSRLVEIDLAAEKNAGTYKIEQLLTTVHKGVWSELETKRVEIDPFRQALQWSYVQHLTLLLTLEAEKNNDRVIGTYERSAIAAQLSQLHKEVNQSIRKTKNAPTRGHLIRIKLKLDGLFG